MLEIIHSFLIGIAFAVGVTVGAILCRIATKEGRKETIDEWKAHQKQVEDRLMQYVIQTTRIADALETKSELSKPKPKPNE